MRKPYLLLFMVLSFSASAFTAPDSLIILENGETRLGILAGVGGRIVYLSSHGSENILKSDSALWDEPESERPVPGYDSEFKAYNGHIVWVGPQSEWWAQQEGNPARKKNKANWPPDPWLIYGKYEILERTDTSLKMMSPYSEISGLRLMKYVRVEKDGSVYFEVEGINYNRLPVSWDLWLNTRVDGYSMAYVPVEGDSSVRVDEAPNPDGRVSHAICRNFFFYLPSEPTGRVKQKDSKAYLTPSEGWLAAFTKGHCLRIRFPLYPPEKTHPQQGMVELYDHTSLDRHDALMELEYHGPYKTLQPGEHFKTWERWTVYRYRGSDKPSRQTRFLLKRVKKDEG